MPSFAAKEVAIHLDIGCHPLPTPMTEVAAAPLSTLVGVPALLP